MSILKQATIWGRKFLMVLSSDHITGATGKSPALKISVGPGAAGVTPGGTVTELDSTNMPGWYQIAYLITDLSLVGDIAVHATAAACDPTDFVDQINTNVFADLLLDSSGRMFITSQVKQNTQFTVPFVMTVGGIPTANLTGFTAQRAFGASGFSTCQNAVSEVGGAGNGAGWYTIVLPAIDTNSTVIELHITQPGADDRNITIYTQP